MQKIIFYRRLDNCKLYITYISMILSLQFEESLEYNFLLLEIVKLRV